jgi:hypothetical protein
MNNTTPFTTLLQVKDADRDPGLKSIGGDEPSTGIAWMIVAVVILGLLGISFKTARRNHME